MEIFTGFEIVDTWPSTIYIGNLSYSILLYPNL